MDNIAAAAAGAAGTTTTTDDAANANEAKMLLQIICDKQKIADMQKQTTPIMMEEQNDDDDDDDANPTNEEYWLDEEMKSIQWPLPNNENNTTFSSSSSSWKEATSSFFAASNTTIATNGEEGDVLQGYVNAQSTSIESFLISIRRLSHRYPELMYQERMTSQIVQRVLRDMGITNYTVGWAKNIHSKYYNPANTGKVVVDTTEEEEGGGGGGGENDGGGHGIVVDIGSGQEPCILLRADMDALPIVEQTPLPPDVIASSDDDGKFHSNHHGIMHACGHDAHMAMLLGATYLIKSLEEEEQQQNNGNFPFPGTIRIIFQPAEEGGAGAKRMREEGVLTNFPPVKYAFGMRECVLNKKYS